MLGTAGHVDHGKTALVMALTGIDTDRLPEEKARGISIALGFAQLELTGGPVALVDVPGHERFVRHMVAGASGIDGYLLCVAADDGVMPQTREHMAVLALLGVEDGVVAITKSDLVDPAAAAGAAGELVGDGVEVVPVSAVSGVGLDTLRDALERLRARLRRRTAGGRTRLFVDRAFTVTGAGTVVTGTLWGAPIAAGDRVLVHPSGVRSRVRSVEVHDATVDGADGGRVALNLAGVSRDQAPRGSVVVAAEDEWQPTERVDVMLEWLDDAGGPLTTRRRLQAFLGTAEVAATCVLLDDDHIAPGARGAVQLRLEATVLAAVGDRLVLRSAERRTVGGAVVLDPLPPKRGRRRRDVGASRQASQPRVEQPPAPPALATLDPDPLDEQVAAELAAAGRRPPGVAELAARLGRDRREVDRSLARLVTAGRAMRGGELWFDAQCAAHARQLAVAALAAGPLGIGALRDVWDVGRKHALALAQHLDSTGVTRRVGDQRVLRRGAAASVPTPPGHTEDPPT